MLFFLYTLAWKKGVPYAKVASASLKSQRCKQEQILKTKTKTAAYKTKTKTTGSKQRHLTNLTFN